MTDKKPSRKCVFRDIRFKKDYVSGVATYQSGLHNAQIFDEDKIPNYIKNSLRDEIIYLDSEEGLELLAEEFKFLDGKIPQLEYELNELKKGREKLYKANPEMISAYISEYNKRNTIIQISKDEEATIIKRIVEQKF
jgi:hypothetical protein